MFILNVGTNKINKAMEREIEVILPELKNDKYIEYSVYNPYTLKLERYRIHKGISKFKNDKVGLKAYANKLIKEYTSKLRAGWRPWSQDIIIYKDEFVYNTEQANFGNYRKDAFYIRKYSSLFYSKLKESGLAKKSLQTYQSKLRIFLMWLEKHQYDKLRPAEITNIIIKDFFGDLIKGKEDKEGLDRATIGNYRLIIHKFFEFCKKSQVVRDNPVFDIELPLKKVDEAARPILDCDLERILTEAAKKSPQFLLACLFQMLCCCRPKELRFMKIKDVDVFNGVIYINNEGGKTGVRNIQMPQILIDICKEMNIYQYNRELFLFGNNGEPGTVQLPINKLGNMFREIREKLKLPSTYKFYSFKHTGAGKLLESGATVIEVMKLLGHSSLESTIHYIHRHFGDKSEKVMNFYPDAVKGAVDLFRRKG